jgi:hypothetical protein
MANPADALQAENDFLRQQVQQLAVEAERSRQVIAALTAERDDYRRAVYASLKQEFEREALEFRIADYTLSAEEVFAELETPRTDP